MSNIIINRPRKNNGAAAITAVLFFVIISTVFVLGLSAPVVRDYTTARDLASSKGAYYLSEAGLEDVMYRVKKSIGVTSPVVLSLDGNIVTTTLTMVNPSKQTISSVGDISTNTRRVTSDLTTAIGDSFVYGAWVGAGGIYLANGSSVTGNLYSEGPICGGGSTGATCSGGSAANIVSGTVISSGSTGTDGIISRIENQGGASMYAGTITNSIIAGTPYCTINSGNSPSGCSTLQAQSVSSLPLSESDVADLEAAANAGGSVTCSGGTYTINSTRSLGPRVIPCDLEIKGNSTVLTLTGHIWVTGNITISGTPLIKVDQLASGQNMVIIADNPSNRVTSSQIVVGNGPEFAGAPGGESFVMLLSENNDASLGGSNYALNINNNANGDLLLYTRLGSISIENNAEVTNITGYKIEVQNNAVIIYETGLSNSLFTGGPGGSWRTKDWKMEQ